MSGDYLLQLENEAYTSFFFYGNGIQVKILPWKRYRKRSDNKAQLKQHFAHVHKTVKGILQICENVHNSARNIFFSLILQV